MDLYPHFRVTLHNEVILKAKCSIRVLLLEHKTRMAHGEGMLQDKLLLTTSCLVHALKIAPQTVILYIRRWAGTGEWRSTTMCVSTLLTIRRRLEDTSKEMFRTLKTYTRIRIFTALMALRTMLE